MTEDRGLVAITGANGTIGYACVVYALKTGYRVRCVVRRKSVLETIRSGASVQQYLDRIEYALVPDNAVSGAYDGAVAGAKYVVHIAGAWPLPTLHPDDDIYYPFINSTKGMIEASKKSGTVRRIVFTQAGAGLVNSEDGDTLGTRMERVLDENVKIDEASLAFRPPLKSVHNAYCSAKAQCMDYLNKLCLSNTLPFSIVQVIPGTVIGPSEFTTTSTQALAQLDRQSKALLFDDMKPRYAFGFVHLQDCARVHIEALDETKVKDENLPPWFIAASTESKGRSGEEVWNDVADMVEREYSSEVESGIFRLGRSKVPINMPYRADSRLTERVLLGGERIRGLSESVEDVARWYLQLKSNEA
ncbi:NAD(P)-binding protein [Plenodomus tracheiphilus IPT5]|uniref:NAD(P)-binding protein n=1 Tax=Plenodomus tracheiphilus IPT5 TaxID=1408161 RepID=A0A6A7BDX5_9PLEO|nr:NAD(P)-binding protein [Plenodomus tracheiphilus IPT5]